MRIPILVTRALGNLEKRQYQPRPNGDGDDDSGPTGSQGKSLIVAVVFVAVLLFSLFIYVSLRILRRTRPEPPKWLPQFIKSWWTKWRPGTYIPTPVSETAASSMSSRHTDRSTNHESHRDRHRNRDRDRDRERRRREVPTQGIDRNTSIRSIMTLPEYRPVAAAGKERTIGREGERAGIDIVLEFPESATEEEERREEHMQALYEIRLARQLERAEARESAAGGSRRNRHDSSPSGRDRGRNRDVSSSSSLAAALAAVSERDRRLSNVAYAEVGLARPDGSRVRASSTASERDNQPLLSSGASMGHTRNISVESVEMFSARPSMETRPRVSSDTRSVSGQQVRSMLNVDRGPSPPPDYGGPPLEAPPDYDQLHQDHEDQHGHMNMQVPLLRVEAASPEPPRLPTYPPPTR